MAITEYQAVLRLTPDNAMDRYQLALTYLKQGNTDMARKEVEQILTMRPDLYEVRQLLNDIISGRQ
jgi:Tfp pilus assembly protein PilF